MTGRIPQAHRASSLQRVGARCARSYNRSPADQVYIISGLSRIREPGQYRHSLSLNNGVSARFRCWAGLLGASLGGGLLVFALSCAGASKNVNIKIGGDSNGKEIRLEVGQEFTLALPENPTTGYTWKFATSGNSEQNGAPVCSRVGDSFLPPGGNAASHVGSPGVHEWRFRADRPGSANIEMHLIRGWDATSAKQSFSLRLRVP